MRKLLLFLIASSFILAASAGVPFKATHHLKKNRIINTEMIKMNPKELKAKADFRVITERPEGEVKIYNRSGQGVYISGGDFYAGEQYGSVEIVYAEDGTVYIKNILCECSAYYGDSWVEGTIEGNEIHVPVGQSIYWSYDYQAGVVIGMGSTRVEDGSLYFELDTRATEAVYVIDGETISLQGTYDNPTGSDYPEFEGYGLGCYWTDDNSFGGFNEWYTVLTEVETIVTPTVITEIPEGCQTNTYYRNSACINSSSWGISGGTTDGKFTVAFDLTNDEVYVQNLAWYYNNYNVWVKGTVDWSTGIIRIPTGQYLTWNDDYEYGVQLVWGNTYVYEEGVDEETGEPLYYLGFEVDDHTTDIQLRIKENNLYLVGSEGDINLDFPFNYEATGMMTIWSDDLSMSSIEFNNGEEPFGYILSPLTPPTPPTASIPSGSTVSPRTELYLSAEGNSIYYAIDYAPFGTGNFEWKSYHNDEPIIINSDMKVYAYATKDGYNSTTAVFTYYVEDNYPLLENASFTVDKTNTLIDNYLTFRVQFDLNEEYKHKISNLELFVVLPPSCPLYDNSVMVGNFISNYFFESNGFVIPLLDDTEIIRFCAIPRVPGDQNVYAYIQCKYNGVTRRAFIDSVQFCAVELTLNVPPLTNNPTFLVSGSATKGKTVKVYIDGVEAAQTECLENGSWRTYCSLNQPENPSTHWVYAIVETTDGVEYRTDTKKVLYRGNAPQADKIKMIYDGQTVVFDLVNGTAEPLYYIYYPSISQFTFVAKLKGTTTSVSNLKIKVLDTSGEVTTYDAVHNAYNDEWVCTANYPYTDKLPTSVGVEYDYVWEGVNEHYENVFIDNTNGVTPNVIPCIDPSGFVYEGVPSNRLEGVTATAYYKDSETGDPVLWDAEQYEQQNPLLTDENGYYRWDVPIGMWQVKYEKEGYETTYSDWLPIPPPQLDVNIGMVQMRQPEVINAHAYPQAVELEFDKYMFPETLTSDNITVSVNGVDVSGTVELLNAEVDDPNAITSIRRAPGTGLTFASRVRFNADQPFNVDKVTLHVKRVVESYAGVQMNEDYDAVLPLEYEMTRIVTDATLDVAWGKNHNLIVAVEPAAAAMGKTLTVRTLSPMIVSTDAETYTFDENGRAVVRVHGDLPGMGTLLFGIEGYNLTATTRVNVEIGSDTGLRGDVNGDGEVNIADVNAVIDIILGGKADADTRYRADVNGDGEVNIADINAVIDIILNPATNMMLKVNCDDLLHMDDVTMKPGDVRTLQVTVDHAAHYSALQCDIVLPAGLTLMDVYAPGANTVRTSGVNDNTCRVLNYSMARLPFVGDSQPVMTVTVRADAALAPESEISLTNVVLADAGNKAWRVSDCTARVNNASGINDMTATVDRVWVEGRTLFIESRQDGTAQLAMINGMVSNIPLKAGINRQRLDRGIYIVVINGQSHKIAIK